MPSSSERISKLLISARWLLLAAAAAAALFAMGPARRIQFDRSIENMFAADDPLLPPYRRLKQVFGGNEVVVAVYEDEDLFHVDGRGLQRLATVSRRLKQTPGVRDVLSLVEVNEALEQLKRMQSFLGGGPQTGSAILHRGDPLAERYRDLFQGYTHSADQKTAALVCMLEPEGDAKASRRETIDLIRSAMRDLPDDLGPGAIAGEPVMVADGFDFVERDGRRLGWTTTILLALTIALCFRSVRWVLIPVAVVQFALLLTKAVIAWNGWRLSMVSSMLTAIVTVVGVATVVHVIVRFQEARVRGAEPRQALAQTAVLLAGPIFWACATDAVGFASLMLARVGPIQDFGVMMAIGSLFVMVSVVLITPGLALLGAVDTDPRRVWGDRRLVTQLQRPISWVEKRPWSLAALLAVLVGLLVCGVFWLDVETDFTRNFRAGSDVVRSYRFVEARLGGAGVWDVVAPAPHPIHQAYIDRVLRFEEQLRAIEAPSSGDGQRTAALAKVISLADVVDAAKTGGLLRIMPARVRVRGVAKVMPAFADALYNHAPDQDGRYYMRIMLRTPEQQPAAQKQRLIDEVTRIARQEFPETQDGPAAEATGFFVLLTNLIRSVIRDQWVCFAAAAIGIGLMMMTAFRSPILAAVALVPNALPILVVLGAMGWLGMRINMGAAMIAAVSMGLSVDSSIHYLYGYRRARRAGKTMPQSLVEVQSTVGRALVFSTLALIIGFSGLCISQFVPTIYFGALVGLAMLGGLLGNLLVLPLLLKLTSPLETWFANCIQTVRRRQGSSS